MSSNVIQNINSKYAKLNNKNSRNNIIVKKNEIKDENMIEKNNIIFINNTNSIQANSSLERKRTFKNLKVKEDYLKKNLNIYCNESKKKKIMNEKMKYLINNITNDDNISNGVNIHNINLINSMNNITYYDSFNENKISNLRKDLLKYPINQFNSQQLLKTNNILVKKNSVVFDNNKNCNLQYNEFNNKNNNNGTSSVTSLKKDSFNELAFKKMNLTLNNFKSLNKNNKGNNFSIFNNKDNSINTIKNIDNLSESDGGYQGQGHGQIIQIKNRNNNSLSKNLNKKNAVNKNDFGFFNTFNKNNNSICEKEINGNKIKNKQNVINVNKLEAFKINNSNKLNTENKRDNSKNLYLTNSKNSENNKKSLNDYNSSVYYLVSNKNLDNYYRSKLDIEDLNKIKKNINDEKICNNKSKDFLNNQNKEKSRKLKKTKSEEKNFIKNMEKFKKKRTFSSYIYDENNNSKGNLLGNTYIKDMNSSKNKIDFNKCIFANLNSESNAKRIGFKHLENEISLNFNNQHEKIKKIKKNEKSIEKNKNISPFGKIEVNKKSYAKNNLPKKNFTNKLLVCRKSSTNTMNTKNEILNLYETRTYKSNAINNLEQIKFFSNNYDCCGSIFLNNYKNIKDINDEKKLIQDEKNTRKKSAPKKIISNIIYNKKQLNIKKLKKSREDKLLSPPLKNQEINIQDLNIKSNGKNIVTDEMISNFVEEEISSNFNDKENDITNDLSENTLNKNININNKTEIAIGSPTNTVYKKPFRNLNNSSNFSITNGKDSINSKIKSSNNKINENDSNFINNIFLYNSKKKNTKRQLNIKLNRYMENKEFSTENDKIKKNNIIININNDNEDLIPKLKDSNTKYSINSYKSNNKNDVMINIEQFSYLDLNNKVHEKNCFIKKYYNYFIDYHGNKDICYTSKLRINKNNLIINDLPIKKICYYSKIRKIFVTTIPKIEICYFKKNIIQKNNKNKNKNNTKIINRRCNRTEEENKKSVNNDYIFINKRFIEENDNNKFINNQISFASIYTNEQNNNENNNCFEISFGKKSKSLINLNNDIIKKSYDANNNKENDMNDNIIKIKNKFLNNKSNIVLSPSKLYLNNNNNNINANHLQKTEKGLKIIEKLVTNKILSPFSTKNINIFFNDKNEKSDKNKNNNLINVTKKKITLATNKINEVFNKKNNEEKNILSNNNDNVNMNEYLYNKIKNDFIELLNIITINNYNVILNKISNLILNNNNTMKINFSEIIKNQNEFIDIIINKAMNERIYIKLYSILCKDLFVSLMTVINNYSDDMDIFNKKSNDKSFKIILTKKLLEKINKSNFKIDKDVNNKDNNKYEDNVFFCNLKFKFIGIMNFIGELLEVKLISQKTCFEILDILYKKYINGHNNSNQKNINYNDLYLEGMEILLKRMKTIIYAKNNPEHVQHYNRFIKNYLNTILKNRKKDLKKYLYYKIYNIIESQKNEEEINNNNNKKRVHQLNTYMANDKNEDFSDNNTRNNSLKYNFISEKNNSIQIQSKENVDNYLIEIIRKDIETLIYDYSDINETKNKNEFFNEINKKYNEEINIKKTIDIWEIFYCYIEVCIDIVTNEENIYIINEYIDNIINNFAIDLPNERWEMLHYKLISLFLNIYEICIDNVYMHQIMGYLLFLLINNKLFFIKDLNNFLNKDNQTIIDIAKVVKYTIFFADKDAKKYHNDFKQTKLFIGNEHFYNIVTLPLMKKFF